MSWQFVESLCGDSFKIIAFKLLMFLGLDSLEENKKYMIQYMIKL